MQLTRHTDYAIRTLMYLAEHSGPERVQIQSVCEYFSISQNHLSKVVNSLAKHGFIDSQRGRGGGICLGKSPTEIKLGDIIRLMEASLNPIDCNKPPCVLRNGCQFKGIINEAMQAFLATLDNYTLADINDQDLQVLRLY